MNDLVFVDSSIWIDFFKDAEHKNTRKVKELLEQGRVAISHIVIAEILPFVSREQELQSIRSYFNALTLLPFSAEDWEEMINLRCLLNAKGISGTSIPDCIIATICIKHKAPVYSEDKHFKLFSKHIPLVIY